MFQKMRLIKDLFVKTKALLGQEKKGREREGGREKEGGRRVRHTQRGRSE